jgi:hypothetical protein
MNFPKLRTLPQRWARSSARVWKALKAAACKDCEGVRAGGRLTWAGNGLIGVAGLSCCGRCGEFNQRPHRLQHSQHLPPCARYVQSQMSLDVADISLRSSLAARHLARITPQSTASRTKAARSVEGDTQSTVGAGQAYVQPLDITRAPKAGENCARKRHVPGGPGSLGFR